MQWETREDGASPSRSRRCNRYESPKMPLSMISSMQDGKAGLVG